MTTTLIITIITRDELAYCTQLLRAAMTAKSIDNLHVALDRAEGAPGN